MLQSLYICACEWSYTRIYYIHSTPSQPHHHNTFPNLEQVRAQIESQCTLIAMGQASIDSVVEHSLRNFEAKYRFFVNRIDVRAFLMVFVSCVCALNVQWLTGQRHHAVSYTYVITQLMDSLFEASFSPLAQTGKPLSKCGKCKRFMK